MSFTRRQFLLLTSSVATGFILPSYLKKAEEWFDKTAQPLLIPQAGADIDLYATKISGGYEFRLGSSNINPPEMTWKEVYEKYHTDWCENILDWLELDDIGDFDVDSPADIMCFIDMWARSDSPTAKAYYYLEKLNIGPILEGKEGVGEIQFHYDGGSPGNDYLGVQAPDQLSLSLLQERLNQLDTGIRVRLDN